MANITFTVPDAAVPRIVEAICARYGYIPTSAADGGEFTKKMILKMLQEITLSYEEDKRNTAARNDVNDPVNQMTK